MRLLVTIALTVILMACCIKWAYLDRGYWAVGGEWLLWIVPLLGMAANCKEETK